MTHTAQCLALGSRREHSLHDWDQGYDHFRSSQHSVVTEPGSGGKERGVTLSLSSSGDQETLTIKEQKV